jgi:hypothetical protein
MFLVYSVVEATKRRVSLELVVEVDGRSGLADEETSLRNLELVNEEACGQLRPSIETDFANSRLSTADRMDRNDGRRA